MARESRATTRTSPTATCTEQKRKGMNRTGRISTTVAGPGGEVTINIPLKADCIVIENVGANPIRIVFDTDPFVNHFEIPTFAVGGALSRLTLSITGGKDIKMRSTGGIGDAQYILCG